VYEDRIHRSTLGVSVTIAIHLVTTLICVRVNRVIVIRTVSCPRRIALPNRTTCHPWASRSAVTILICVEEQPPNRDEARILFINPPITVFV